MPKLLPLLLVLLAVSPRRADAAARPSRQGVKTPGVQIPIAQLKPEAVFDVPGTPDWLAIDDHMWVSNSPKDTVSRLDPKNSTVVATVATGKRPCSGLAVGFGSLWVPNCGDQTLVRVDLKTNAVTATIPTTIGSSEGGIATGAGSVWLVIDKRGTLVRFDPATNKPVAEIHVRARVVRHRVRRRRGVGDEHRRQQPHARRSRDQSRRRDDRGRQGAAIPRGRRRRGVDAQSGRRQHFARRSENQQGGRDDRGRHSRRGRRDCGRRRLGVGDGRSSSRSRASTRRPTKSCSSSSARAATPSASDSGSIWLSNLRQGNVWRLDPRRIEATVAF